MKTTTFLITSLAIAAVGTFSSAWLSYRAQPVGRVAASWAFKANDVEHLRDYADIIVVAQAGDSYFHRAAYSDGTREDHVPFELVELEVLRSVKGAEVGQTLLVERAGGIDMDGRLRVFDMDGGAFVEGQTYLLFLNHQEEGDYLYQVNDQARYQVADGELIAVQTHEMEHDPVAAVLAGRSLEAALELLTP